MQNHLEENLKLLELYDAELADRLRNHNPSNRIETFITPQNFISLRAKTGNGVQLIHSGQEPIREAERWMSTLDIQNPYNIMVFGCGLFYHSFQLVKHYHSNLRHLVIVEKDIDILHTSFSAVDISNFLRTKMTYFITEPSPADIRKFMNQHLTSFTIDGLSIVEHPASCSLYPEFYKETKSIIDECLQNGTILLRTKVALGGMIQENIIRNSPNIFSLPSISVFSGMFPNIPAFIIGAGPSLDKNIEQLAAVQDKGVIIAADTVLKPLRERGIHPHIVISTDPTELNNKHFEGINDLGETILAFALSVNSKIPKDITGTKVVIPTQNSRLLSLFNKVKQETNPLQTGVNVGQTCFNLAKYLGCDPIVMVGLDFSFPVEGGTTHASGTALQRPIIKSETPGKMKVELLDAQRSLEEFDPILIPGSYVNQVATNKFWLAYLRSMEQAISNTSARVINCTEGGALVEGAQNRKLADVINDVCINDAQARSNLHAVVGFFFGEPLDEGIQILNECLTILKTAIKYADKGLQELSALKTVAHSVSPDKGILQEKLDAITEAHKQLVQDHKVYIVLDEAADAILHPFLQQNKRPSGNLVSEENIQISIERYTPYFENIKDICERYSAIISETIESMESTGSNLSDFSF